VRHTRRKKSRSLNTKAWNSSALGRSNVAVNMPKSNLILCQVLIIPHVLFKVTCTDFNQRSTSVVFSLCQQQNWIFYQKSKRKLQFVIGDDLTFTIASKGIQHTWIGRSPRVTDAPYFTASSYAIRNSIPGGISSFSPTYQKSNWNLLKVNWLSYRQTGKRRKK